MSKIESASALMMALMMAVLLAVIYWVTVLYEGDNIGESKSGRDALFC